MNKTTIIGLCLWGLTGAALPALAQDTDANQCLECHEPIEDWQGMTVEEIVADAKTPENKRHAHNMALSDEQLKLIVLRLMPIETN